MSLIFGLVIQQAHFVPGIQKAMEHWLARGIGPFYIEEHRCARGLHDGGSTPAGILAARVRSNGIRQAARLAGGSAFSRESSATVVRFRPLFFDR